MFRKQDDGSTLPNELIIFGHYFSKKTSAGSRERVRCRFSRYDGTKFHTLSEDFIQRYENPSKVVAKVPDLPVGRYYVHVLVERGGEWRTHENQYFEIDIASMSLIFDPLLFMRIHEISNLFFLLVWSDGESPRSANPLKHQISDQGTYDMDVDDERVSELFECGSSGSYSALAVDNYGFNCLHVAVLSQNTAFVSKLIQKAESVGILDSLVTQKVRSSSV